MIFLCSPASFCGTFWWSDAAVPWNDEIPVAKEATTSMLSIAPTVNRLCQNLNGHKTLSFSNCSMSSFPKFHDIFNNQSLLIESPKWWVLLKPPTTDQPTTDPPTHRPLTTYPPTHRPLTHRPTIINLDLNRRPDSEHVLHSIIREKFKSCTV